MKIIDIIYRVAAIIYTFLFILVLVRWQFFGRPIAESLGFLGDLIIIFSIMTLIVGMFLIIEFNQKFKKYPKANLLLKIIVIILSLMGSYYIILVTYINIDVTVLDYWQSGEWKW